MSKVASFIKRIAYSSLVIFSVSQSASAMPILSFNNAQADVSQTANIGDIVTFELWFSGLEIDDVGGFDFLLGFNSTVSQLNSAQANPALTDFDEFDINPKTSGLEFVGVSYLFDLSAQVDEFMLATISFVATSVGVSDIVLSDLLISDSLANAIDISVFNAQIIVNNDPNTPIPEPASLAIFLLGLLGLTIRNHAINTD